jgi:hypothetical protein
VEGIMGLQDGEVKAGQARNPKKQNSLTVWPGDRTMAGDRLRALPVQAESLYGGDTASTGVKTRGMHAERHRLVNPVEHNVTANTQLALAA